MLGAKLRSSEWAGSTVNYWAFFFWPVISLFRLYSLLYIFFSLNFFLRCWKSNSESLTCHTSALTHNGATNPGNGFLCLLETGSSVQPKLVSDSWAQVTFQPQPPTEYCRCVPPHPAFRKWQRKYCNIFITVTIHRCTTQQSYYSQASGKSSSPLDHQPPTVIRR